jgi:uncharacterized Tic20 family protein
MPFEDVPPDRPVPEQSGDVPLSERLQELPTEVVPTTDSGEVLSKQPTAEERQWGMFAHLSALLGLLVGGLTFVGPLVVWLMKKDESKFVDYHGKEALNFQLNILIYSLISVALMIATCFVLFPLPIVVAVYAIVMPILAGIKANEGELYEYPLTFRMIK